MRKRREGGWNGKRTRRGRERGTGRVGQREERIERGKRGGGEDMVNWERGREEITENQEGITDSLCLLPTVPPDLHHTIV